MTTPVQLTAASGAFVRSITFSRADGIFVGGKLVSTDGSAAEQIGTQTADSQTIAFGNGETITALSIWQSDTAVGRVWITTSAGQTFDFGEEGDDMEQSDADVFSGYLFGFTADVGEGNVLSNLNAWFFEEVDGGYASNFGGAGYSETITYDVIEEIDFDSINYLVLINADGDAGGVVGEVDEDGDVEGVIGEVDEDGDVEGVDEVEEDYVEEDE